MVAGGRRGHKGWIIRAASSAGRASPFAGLPAAPPTTPSATRSAPGARINKRRLVFPVRAFSAVSREKGERADAPPVVEIGRPFAPRALARANDRGPAMDFFKVWALRGPNVWARCPVLEVGVDLGRLRGLSTSGTPGFIERLLGWLPSLGGHATP